MHEAAFRAQILIEYDITDGHLAFRNIMDDRRYDMDRSMGTRVGAYSAVNADAPVVANFKYISDSSDSRSTIGKVANAVLSSKYAHKRGQISIRRHSGAYERGDRQHQLK